MSRQKFSHAMKRAICIEYMQSGLSRKEISLKYNLPNVNTLSSWINSCLSVVKTLGSIPSSFNGGIFYMCRFYVFVCTWLYIDTWLKKDNGINKNRG